MSRTSFTTRLAAVSAATATLVSLVACAPESPVAAPGETGYCGDFTVAVADDDLRRSALWAVENGEVDTDAFANLEFTYLPFPGLIQATGTDQFDLVESSLIGIPLARSKGVDLKVVALSAARTADEDTVGGAGIYVADDSPITSAEDLVGKTVGVTSFGSTTTLVERIVLDEAFGLNSALQGGDISWVELDPAQLISSLERGQIDAVSASTFTAWTLGNTPGLRRLYSTDAAWRDINDGSPFLGAAYQALASQIEANKPCYLEFQSVLAESVAYARDHVSEIAEEVSAQTELPAAYIEFQWGEAYNYVGSLEPEWVEAAQALWDTAAAVGEIPAALNIEDEIVK